MLKFIADNSKLIILICLPIMGILLNIIIYILSSRRLTNIYENRIKHFESAMDEQDNNPYILEIFNCIEHTEKMYEDGKFHLKENNFLQIGIITVFIIVHAILS